MERNKKPEYRAETVRQRIFSAISGKELNAKEISSEVGIPEKDVYDHLSHIQKTALNQGTSLKVVPAECRKCGFIFSKREKLKSPGKCPRCRSETITAPAFTIK